MNQKIPAYKKTKVVNRLEKKYQFFISSTYEDLKEERNKAIQAILTMNQFPIGMEMCIFRKNCASVPEERSAISL